MYEFFSMMIYNTFVIFIIHSKFNINNYIQIYKNTFILFDSTLVECKHNVLSTLYSAIFWPPKSSSWIIEISRWGYMHWFSWPWPTDVLYFSKCLTGRKILILAQASYTKFYQPKMHRRKFIPVKWSSYMNIIGWRTTYLFI